MESNEADDEAHDFGIVNDRPPKLPLHTAGDSALADSKRTIQEDDHNPNLTASF